MDLKTNYDIILDIKRNNYVAIRTKQLDKNSRFINVSVTDNGEPLSLDSTVSAMFIVKKNNGNTSEAPANIDTENNKIICEINDNMSATPGMNDAEIQLLDVNNKTILTTMKFKIVVDSINSTIDDLLSSSEYKSLAELVIVGKEKLELLDKLIDEIDNVQANYDEAEQARVAAETARVQAEKSRVSAESARVAAESKRASEESKRATAESSRETKESQRVEAETSRKQAETSRASAESGRVSAENTRVSNENARKSAETSRDNAEKSRVDAEQDRADAEEERITSESARKSAESSRVQTEANRVSAETSRANAETNRVNAEKGRVAAESSRTTAETNRSDAEKERVANENERKSAEVSRVSAEASRVSAEAQRVEAEKTRTTIHNGNGVPSADLGKVGDVYIDKSDTASAPYNYYIKEASGWVAQGTMHGLNGSVVNYPNDSETDAPSTSLFEDAIVGGYLEQEGSTFSGATSDYGVDIHEIVGKTYQQTTNGYQLFDQSKISSSDGITATKNDDGSITLNGTATADADFFKIGAWNQSEVVLSGITKWKADVSNSNIIIIGVNGTSREISVNLSTAENSYTGELTYFLMRVPQGKTLNNFTFKFMLYQDGDGTWEPFTGGKPAPNPDYPMEIENVELSKIISSSKNILSSLPNGLVKVNCTYSFNDATKEITLISTINGNIYIGEVATQGDSYSSDKGKQYLIPKNAEQIYYRSEKGVFSRSYVAFFDKDNIGLGYSSLDTGNAWIPKGAKYANFRIGRNGTENGKSYTDKLFISFEPISGDFVTPHYNEVETSLKLAEGETYIDGEPTTRKKAQITFDGSSDENWGKYATATFNVERAFRIKISDMKNTINSVGETSLLCNRFVSGGYVSRFEKVGVGYSEDQWFYVRLDDEAYSSIDSVDAFKAWLQTHPTTIEYELETPIEETIKLPTIPSYHPYTNIWTDSPIEPEKIVWRAKTASGLSIENKERLDQVQYDGLYAQGETYSGIASNKGIKLHKVVGKTTQQTTNGYQLFDASKFPTKTQGGATVTNNNDGSFTISGNGTLSDYFSQLHWHTHEETLQLLKTGKIYAKNNDTIPRMCAYLYYDSNSKYYTLIDKNKSESDITEEMLSKSDCELRVYIYGYKGNAIQPGTIKPMLYQDGDGTWEQFTGGKPAPNADYAMPIENAEISKIESCGRNLLKLISTLEETTINGVTFKPIFESGYLKCITVNGTATKQLEYILQDKLELKNKSYVLQGCPQGGTVLTYCLICSFYDKSSGSWKNEKYDIGNELTFNGGDYLTQIAILIRGGTVCNNLIFYPMLRNAEDLDTTYEPPKNAIVETSLTLAQDDIYQNGTITRARKQVTFDGSSDEGWSKSTSDENSFVIKINDIDINSNTVYCNRFKFTDERNVFGTFFINSSGNLTFVIEGINELEEWKTWLSTHNLVVEYELDTPTTEEFKVPTIPSYNPLTNIWIDNTLPTDMEWELLANSDNSLQIESLEKRIAALETTLINVVSLMPESVQATMIENDVNNLMNTI